MKIVSSLRIVYVLLAIGLGATMFVITANHTGSNGSPAPEGSLTHWFLRPVQWMIFFLGGTAAWKRRWDLVWPATWFLLGPTAANLLAAAWHAGWWRALLPGSPQAASLYVLVLGGSLSFAVRDGVKSSVPTGVPGFIAFVMTLIAMAAYVSRGIAALLDPAFFAAFKFWGHAGGTTDAAAVNAFVTGITTIAAALALLAGVEGWWMRGRRVAIAALALAAGLAFANFLAVLDVIGGSLPVDNLRGSAPDAMTFLLCMTALVLSLAPNWHKQTPPIPKI